MRGSLLNSAHSFRYIMERKCTWHLWLLRTRPTRWSWSWYTEMSLHWCVFFFNSDPTGISLAAYCWMTIGEAENTEHMFLGFSRIGIEPTIYRTRSKLFNHYITDSIDSLVLLIIIQIYSSVRLLFQTLIIIIALLI